ncbi:hypothetical protein F4775DRAFT_67138 [Biscogniauxia sp. FL1348]|nr:hypothetical protein F4775DRAFT_67138 [Biscogniauxia sp. FL1348]
MSSEKYPLCQQGICRNLPTFDPSIRDLSAIICGPTGISGFYALRALLDSPSRWARVYTLSRSPLPEKMTALLTAAQRARVVHIPVDLCRPGEAIAEALRAAGARADYVFWYAYLEPASQTTSSFDPANADGLIRLNAPMFDNFLRALPLAGLAPRRIVLQTGGKNYGVHVGRARRPFVESDPQPRALAPNFYYLQEDALKAYCRAHPETSWNVIRPAGIIGASLKSPMNMVLPFGVYAAVQARKGEPLVFGGTFESWEFELIHSSAKLTGFLCEWAALEDKCKNEDFNSQDGATVTWNRFFEELARWFGVAEGVRPPPEDLGDAREITLKGGAECPLGYGPPVTTKMKFTLREWADDPINRKVWEELMAESNGQLTFSPWDPEVDINSVFWGDIGYIAFGSLAQGKPRMFGFSGYIDTIESIFETYKEMEALGMLPPMVAEKARPLI